MLNAKWYLWTLDFIKNFKMRLVIVGIMITIFAITFPSLYRAVGAPAGATITLVVLIASILLGVKAGLLLWVLSIPLFVLEVTLGGQNGIAELIENWPGIVGTLILTIITGLFKKIISTLWHHHQSELRANEERLRKINSCFLSFGASPDENIKRLTSLTGEILGAEAALYTRSVHGSAGTIGFSHATEIDMGDAAFHLSPWHAIIDHHSEGIAVVRGLTESSYNEALKAVSSLHLQTFVGRSVRIDKESTGGLCVLYTADIKPGTADTEILGILASAIAVEEKRKTVEEILKLNAIRLRSLLDTFPHIVWMKDVEGKFISVNQSFVDTFGQKSVDDVLGKTDYDMTPLEFAEKYSADDARVMISRTKLEIEEEIIDKGVKKWFETYKSPIYDEDGVVIGTAGFARDITERRTGENERKMLQAQLLQSQKIESIGTLAAGIAHDFNNILNIIVGNMELMANSVLDEKTTRRISAVASAADRATHLVNQLLMFARKTDINHIPLFINDIIDDTVTLISETFPKTIIVRLNVEDDLPRITADPNQIHQVIMNLSVNARDAMPSGGTLEYSVGTITGTLLRKQFLQADADRYVLLTVKDTGMGMDEATRLKIFDPFFTTKEAGKGTGLGMSVVQGIVHSHRGFIDVQSVTGAGTEVHVYLPAADAGRIDDAQLEHVDMSALSGKETILLIEDEELTRDIAEDLFISHGYTVITAPDGAAGVELFMQHAGTVDLIVSDFGLPAFSGEEVFRRIRALHSTVPFIVISGYLEPDMKASLTELGILDIIPKPFKPNELLSRIRKGLDGRAGG
jgi:PAS domain S-box-containing protein